MTVENVVAENKNFCSCGCGTEIPNNRMFVHNHHTRKSNHPFWKGGRYVTKKGYIVILCPDHPRAKGNKGYVFEHILVMEKHLGRYLTKNEIVHHIDENRQNNDIKNLELMMRDSHTTHHILGKHIDTSDRLCYSCGSPNTLIRKASADHKTPRPAWYHLPNDKVNWYCNKCYKREKTHSLLSRPYKGTAQLKLYGGN